MMKSNAAEDSHDTVHVIVYMLGHAGSAGQADLGFQSKAAIDWVWVGALASDRAVEVVARVELQAGHVCRQVHVAARCWAVQYGRELHTAREAMPKLSTPGMHISSCTAVAHATLALVLKKRRSLVQQPSRLAAVVREWRCLALAYDRDVREERTLHEQQHSRRAGERSMPGILNGQEKIP